MKRRLDVTPQARRDMAAILDWYRENLGARAALKVAHTIRSRLKALEAGRVRGAELVAESRYMRIVAKSHIVIFLSEADAIKIVRIVHGAQDLEAIATDLEADQQGRTS